MNTDDIMQLSLDLCGMKSIPLDSAIFHSKNNIHRILWGIDINNNDLTKAKKEGYDLVISHHPLDQTAFIKMMYRHEELMINAGVAPNLAKNACYKNEEPYRNWAAGLPSNDTQDLLTKIANELDVGLMNIHNPSDELGRIILQSIIDTETSTVLRLMNKFRSIPEISKSGEDVELICGSNENPLGKAVMIHAAGTNGGYHVANALFESGIQTVVYIHLNSPRMKAQLKQENKGNLIITGHYASDSIGINPLIDKLEEKGIDIDCCNNLIRHRCDSSQR